MSLPSSAHAGSASPSTDPVPSSRAQRFQGIFSVGPQQKIVSDEFSRLGSGEASVPGYPQPWSLFQAGIPAQDPVLACV